MITKFENRFVNITLSVAIVLLPLAVGVISASFAGDQMQSFGEMNQPPLSPPGWLFPVAWTILYIMMGFAFLIIVGSEHKYKVGAIALFISQLMMNGLWSPVFFGDKDFYGALILLTLMLITTVIDTITMWQISRTAAKLMMPYIAWMLFATYLNAGVLVLNP